MKKILTIMLILILITASLTFVGCSTDNNTETYAVSLVLGNHRYFPEINLFEETVYGKIYNAAYSYGDCSVVVVDGDPFVAASYNINKPDADIDNSKRKQLAKKNTEQIITEALSAKAQTSEIDTLNAIVSAGRLLQHSSANIKEILVYDSGLSTAGLLDFLKENLIVVEPKLIVERLKELSAIPDLKNLKIKWTGLGEVCGKQDPLTAKYKASIKNLWTSIILAGGGEVQFIDIPLSKKENASELPPCTTIPIVQESLQLSVEIVKPIKLGEEKLGFVANKAVYVDSLAAKETLTPITNFLKANPTKRILIVGTTASTGKEDSCKKLSLDRANACKNTLVEMGVSPSQLETAGLGRTECFLRVDDLDNKGRLVEELAKQNRAVFLFDCESEEANKIKQMVE